MEAARRELIERYARVQGTLDWYMSSNQMGGRAIRLDPNDPGKVAGIWLVMVVDPARKSGRMDLEDLRSRFRTFAGLAIDQPAIESGLERLCLPPLKRDSDLIDLNQEMARRLAQNASLPQRWKEAIESGKEGRILPSLTARPPTGIRPLLFRNTLRYVFYSAVSSFVPPSARSCSSARERTTGGSSSC